jgi:hypothetical protein
MQSESRPIVEGCGRPGSAEHMLPMSSRSRDAPDRDQQREQEHRVQGP